MAPKTTDMKDQITLAKEIATKAHEGQLRWNETPYIGHPAAIAFALVVRYPTLPPHETETAVSAAWLHDTIEDTPLTLGDLREAGIKEATITVVDLLTKRDDEEYLTYLLRLKQNDIARMVKIEDIRNNMSDLDRKRKKSMYEKYQLALWILQGS